MKRVVVLAVALAATACGSPAATTKAPAAHDDVGVFQSIPRGFDTMS